MDFERISTNKIKILIPFEEIERHGLQKDETGYDLFKWEPLFLEIMDKVNEEFDLYIEDTVIIDIYTSQQQGIVFMLTFNEEEAKQIQHNDKENFETFLYPPHVTIQSYRFSDFEHLIQFSLRIYPIFKGGSVYLYKNEYYLWIETELLNDMKGLQTIVLDYSSKSSISQVFLQEYGKTILTGNAIESIVNYFKKL